MKKTLNILGFTIFIWTNLVFGQSDFQTNNRSCDMALQLCSTLNQDFDDRNEAMNCTNMLNYLGISSVRPFYYILSHPSSVNSQMTITYSGGGCSYRVYGPFSGTSLSICEQINMNMFNIPLVNFTNTSANISQIAAAGTYILEVIPSQCFGKIQINVNPEYRLECKEAFTCADCITSFSPEAGKYIVSAWVKEEINDPFVTSYQNAHLNISFQGATQTFSLLPSGKIIDGWQKIEGTIDIPSGSTSIKLSLEVDNGTAYFDDIRFFPYDGSMMSYVYDPISLRLMAELDERNYATLYEYDEEGKLIRVKKETKKGVMTIQENRDNIKKN